MLLLKNEQYLLYLRVSLAGNFINVDSVSLQLLS